MGGLVTPAAPADVVAGSRGDSKTPIALTILFVHVLLVASLGQYYAKLQLDLGVLRVYPTELVVFVAGLLGARVIASVPWDGITQAVLLFCALAVGWVLFGGLGGVDGAGAKAFSFFVYAIVYFVIRGGAFTDDLRWRMLRAFAIASIIGALLGTWQMMTGEPLLARIESSTTGFEETSTGSIRWLAGEFALYGLCGAMVVAVRMILLRRVALASCVVLAAAAAELTLAQHRSGFVAFAVALTTTAGFLGGSSQALRGLLKLLVIMLIGVVVFTWMFGGDYVNDTLNRIGHTGDLSDVNIDWRLLSWFEVFDGIVNRPLGHGFAVWDFLFTWEDPLTGSHNSFLDLTYRIGVPGLIVFLAIPIQLIVKTRRLVRRSGAKDYLLLITVCACMLAFLVFASFNVVLETPYMSIMFWVLLGLGAGALESSDDQRFQRT